MAYQWTPPQQGQNNAGGNIFNTGAWQSEALDLQSRQMPQDLKIAQMQNDTARLPAMLSQSRFNSVWPFLQNQFAHQNVQGQGGQSGPSPEISVGPIWNTQDVQRQVNAGRATNDQATAGRMRQSQRDLGSRGFGSNSPLLAALGAMYQGQNLATNTANERDIRMGARSQNAGHILETQQAREGQFASRQQEDIERRKINMGYNNALLGALSGLV